MEPETIKMVLGIGGFIVAFVTMVWGISSKIVDKAEKSRNRTIDRQHHKNSLLEKEKSQLQKEIESGKQRHVQKLIDSIKFEVGKLDTKVEKISHICTKLETQMENHSASETRVLDEMATFTKETRQRFQQLERDVVKVRTEYLNVGKDITLIKDLATKVRKRGT